MCMFQKSPQPLNPCPHTRPLLENWRWKKGQAALETSWGKSMTYQRGRVRHSVAAKRTKSGKRFSPGEL